MHPYVVDDNRDHSQTEFLNLREPAPVPQHFEPAGVPGNALVLGGYQTIRPCEIYSP